MPTIKKILFPVDFSRHCVGASRYVEALAGRFEAEITLLHVVTDGERVLAEELRPAKQARLDKFLVDELKHFTTHRMCVLGDPAATIVEIARSWNADLVMMPTQGVGFYRRLLLGSVTAKVLHDLDCPIWTGIHAENAPPLEKITCSKVLCAVDLSERSGSVLEWAAFLAREYDAELGIAHAVPDVEVPDPAFVAELIAKANTRIAGLQSAAGTKATVFVDGGDPAKVVTCAAKEFGAELMVIGRHSGTGIAGYLRRNAYAILRESPCPVVSL